MELIRHDILAKWRAKNKTDFEVSAEHLETLYELYDEHAFNYQIQNQSRLKNIKIVFQEDTYPDNLVIGRICDLRFYKLNKQSVINFRISPWVVSRLTNLSNEQYEKIGDDSHKKDIAFLLAFEHQLTHLIFLLWNHKESNVHGKLFNCVHNSFFDEAKEKRIEIMELLTSNDSYPQPRETHGTYSYWSNSCYIDSLSSVLYFCKSSVFRDAIFASNVNLNNYKNMEKMFINPCMIDISEIDYVDLIQNLQFVMFTDYVNLVKSGKTMKCVNARKILASCYPNMKNLGEWDMYNVSDIYDLLAKMFPRLLISNYTLNFYSGNKLYKKLMHANGISMFPFFDFIRSLSTDENETYTLPDWDGIQSDVLVFSNGGSPALINFGSGDSEIIYVPIYEKGKEVRKKIEITKSRYFSEYIINGKYEMIGAVMLHGTIPGESGGVHYTSYIKISDKWVQYNDMGNIWAYTKNKGSFPTNILKERDGIKPELYFYHRIQ